MMRGLKKVHPDHRDYDFRKSFSHLFAGVTYTFPSEYDVDLGLWWPNQEAPEVMPVNGLPPIPAMPYGCTDFGGADACSDEDGVLHNPMDLENVTHANASGGLDIRVMLSATKKVFGRSAYFNIRPAGVVDAFDAARLAMYSALPEKRAVIVGSIWYPVWESVGSDGILPMPSKLQLDGPWHCSVVCGWKTINGIPYLTGKSWQGTSFGDGGYHYFSREVFNSVMSVYATAMFTVSKIAPNQIFTVDLTWAQQIASYIRTLLSTIWPG